MTKTMSPEKIDEIILAVYRARLDDACPGDADRMVAKDGDDGRKQRKRAEFHRYVVTETLVQAGVHTRPERGPPPRKRGRVEVPSVADRERAEQFVKYGLREEDIP